MSFIRRALPAAAIALLLLTLASKPLVHLLTESWWFDAVGFAEVFWTRLRWQLLLFTLTSWPTGRFSGATTAGRSAARGGGGWCQRPPPGFDPAGPMGRRVARAVIVLVALVAAARPQSGWLTVLKALKATPFAARDPIFGRDIGFYLFQLPFVEGLHRWLLGLVLTATLLAGRRVPAAGRPQRFGRRLQLQLHRSGSAASGACCWAARSCWWPGASGWVASGCSRDGQGGVRRRLYGHSRPVARLRRDGGPVAGHGDPGCSSRSGDHGRPCWYGAWRCSCSARWCSRVCGRG